MNLKELSQHLGLSQTTVSRALNGYPEVGEDTRERVMAAARRFDYRPNASARRLATGRAGAIGIVFSTGANPLLDPLFTDFLAGLADQAARAETDVLVSGTLDDEAITYRRLARVRSVDAIVLSGPLVEDPRLAILAKLGLPAVVHGRTRTTLPYAYLDIDNEGAFRRATELLIDFGHRRIGLINGEPAKTFAEDREAGWRSALLARGLPADDALHVNGAMTEENGYRFARRLLEGDDAPTALICGSAFSALGCCRAIRDLGLAIAADVSVIAHDDGIGMIRPEGLSPALTTTFSSIRAAGARIAEIAHELSLGADPATLTEVWPVDLIFRDSAARVKPR